MLTRDEYREQDALGLAALVRSGEVTAGEVLDCALREIDRLNPALNAIVQRNDDQARAGAARVDPALPLAGVPFPAKDVNVDVLGMRTTHACRFFADAPVADADSVLVRRWRAAGLVVTGKTNTPEFATDFGCEPEFYGPTLNPWDRTRTPGGSSGGAAAAAVAAGMVPMAHASDSGGSIRAPASCCGVFGFKPGSGVVATGSPLGALVGGLNSDHAITRTVRDCAALLDATAGPEMAASTPYGAAPGYLAGLEQPVGRLRIGVTELSPAGTRATADICARVQETAARLSDMGHEVVEWDWPRLTDDVFDLATVFWASEIAAVVETHADRIGRRPAAGDLGPLIEWSLARAGSLSSVDVVRARAGLRQVQQVMHGAWQGMDVLMSPVLSESPLPSGLLTDLVNRDVEAWIDRAWKFAPYPEIFNITGQPAMSVPLQTGADGMPVGIHFAAPVGQDGLLLRLAAQLEQAMPWRDRRPPE